MTSIRFTEATGGTITTSGDFKIHTFTGDGCFVYQRQVTLLGGGNKVSYVVVGGGASGGDRTVVEEEVIERVNSSGNGSDLTSRTNPTGITV